eukprot:7386773-Prymnesium_polylepis.2
MQTNCGRCTRYHSDPLAHISLHLSVSRPLRGALLRPRLSPTRRDALSPPAPPRAAASAAPPPPCSAAPLRVARGAAPPAHRPMRPAGPGAVADAGSRREGMAPEGRPSRA